MSFATMQQQQRFDDLLQQQCHARTALPSAATSTVAVDVGACATAVPSIATVKSRELLQHQTEKDQLVFTGGGGLTGNGEVSVSAPDERVVEQINSHVYKKDLNSIIDRGSCQAVEFHCNDRGANLLVGPETTACFQFVPSSNDYSNNNPNGKYFINQHNVSGFAVSSPSHKSQLSSQQTGVTSTDQQHSVLFHNATNVCCSSPPVYSYRESLESLNSPQYMRRDCVAYSTYKNQLPTMSYVNNESQGNNERGNNRDLYHQYLHPAEQISNNNRHINSDGAIANSLATYHCNNNVKISLEHQQQGFCLKEPTQSISEMSQGHTTLSPYAFNHNSSQNDYAGNPLSQQSTTLYDTNGGECTREGIGYFQQGFVSTGSRNHINTDGDGTPIQCPNPIINLPIMMQHGKCHPPRTAGLINHSSESLNFSTVSPHCHLSAAQPAKFYTADNISNLNNNINAVPVDNTKYSMYSSHDIFRKSQMLLNQADQRDTYRKILDEKRKCDENSTQLSTTVNPMTSSVPPCTSSKLDLVMSDLNVKMNSRQGLSSSAGGGGAGGSCGSFDDDELQLPRSVINKLVKDASSKIRVSAEARDVFIICCHEFVRVLSALANISCEDSKKKLVGPDHIVAALNEMGLQAYSGPCLEIMNATQVEASQKRKRLSLCYDHDVSTVERLRKEQQELFDQARKMHCFFMDDEDGTVSSRDCNPTGTSPAHQQANPNEAGSGFTAEPGFVISFPDDTNEDSINDDFYD